MLVDPNNPKVDCVVPNPNPPSPPRPELLVVVPKDRPRMKMFGIFLCFFSFTLHPTQEAKQVLQVRSREDNLGT